MRPTPAASAMYPSRPRRQTEFRQARRTGNAMAGVRSAAIASGLRRSTPAQQGGCATCGLWTVRMTGVRPERTAIPPAAAELSRSAADPNQAEGLSHPLRRPRLAVPAGECARMKTSPYNGERPLSRALKPALLNPSLDDSTGIVAVSSGASLPAGTAAILAPRPHCLRIRMGHTTCTPRAIHPPR
jgi:hypothetical protein